MLIRTHMEELKEHTNNSLYENYRSDKLTQMGVAQDPSVFKEVNPAVKQEEERTLHEQKLQKMESEMKMVFQQKVAEKESKLKQSEEELYARHREMKDQLERQRAELEEKKQRVESGRPIEEKGKRKGFSLRWAEPQSYYLTTIDRFITNLSFYPLDIPGFVSSCVLFSKRLL